MQIAVVGLGLIGGSIAKVLKKNTPHTVLGTDISKDVIYKAKLLDAIDAELTDERLSICDMVILAAWPNGTVEYLKNKAALIKKGATVVDVCGVKSEICKQLWQVAAEQGFLFVGGHPMAGIERSGFENATAKLFEKASMILTPPKGLTIETLENLKAFWMELGFGNVVITTPENHDRVIAYTSQLAHVVSSAYIKSPTALDHKGFSAGSYKDMTRVARLDPNLWTELFMHNREALLKETDALIDRLIEYRDALKENDADRMKTLLRAGLEQKLAADRKDVQ